MGLIRLTTSSPIVSLSDAKTHLRLDGNAEDGLIQTLIVTAQDFLERETRSAIGVTQYALTLDNWPASREVRLPHPPLVAVDGITYRDNQGDDIPLPSGSFVVDRSDVPARVTFTGSLPESADVPSGVRIIFRTGFDEPASVPPVLIHAVKMLTGHLYENREASSTLTVKEVPFAVASICQQFNCPEVI